MKKIVQLFFTLSILLQIAVAQDVIIPGEFERNEGILLKWNYNLQVDSTVSRVAAAASSGSKVWLVFNPEQTTTQSQILDQLLAMGANASNIAFIEGDAETLWFRDYCPFDGFMIG